MIQMHVDTSGQHCILVCPDQLIYNHFESANLTRIEMHGFTCCTTTWITEQDSLTFEAIFGYRNGEVWHACFEVVDDIL